MGEMIKLVGMYIFVAFSSSVNVHSAITTVDGEATSALLSKAFHLSSSTSKNDVKKQVHIRKRELAKAKKAVTNAKKSLKKSKKLLAQSTKNAQKACKNKVALAKFKLANAVLVYEMVRRGYTVKEAKVNIMQAAKVSPQAAYRSVEALYLIPQDVTTILHMSSSNINDRSVEGISLIVAGEAPSAREASPAEARSVVQHETVSLPRVQALSHFVETRTNTDAPVYPSVLKHSAQVEKNPK